ncbi:MAG TPA: gliding motility-associated C-terminal domain-containing protein [Bacteroidales bacterium]|nr:gliding motility-associated C-terminal domain-containing protein [Bacteroidales bacterium]
MRKIYFLLFILPINIFCQTYTVHHPIDWALNHQYMWGPNGSSWSLNIHQDIFNYTFSENQTFGHIEDLGILGEWGAEFDLNAYLSMALTYYASGFNNGWVDINYPVDITLTFPDYGTIIPGQWATVNSDYTVLPSAYLNPHFPEEGIIGMNFSFGTNIDLSGQLCVGGCTPINIFNVDVPYDSLTLIELNTYSGIATYPCIVNNYPDICQSQVIPLIINDIGGTGLSLWADIPYIASYNDYILPNNCLIAKGQDYYMTLGLDIIQFIQFMGEVIGGSTADAINDFIDILSGTIQIVNDANINISLDYTLIDQASLFTNHYLHQDLTFCPTLYTTFHFPTPVQFEEVDTNNVIVQSGINDTITFKVGNNLNILWPCFGLDSLSTGPILHFMENEFNNHVWDSIALNFGITGLDFTLNIDLNLIKQAINDLPPLCVEIDEDNLVCITNQRQDLSANKAHFNFHFGPFLDDTLHITDFALTWMDDTWEIAGFHDSIFPPELMTSAPSLNMHIVGDTVLCQGLTNGVIIAWGNNGMPPYNFHWSTNRDTITNIPIDSIMVGVGTYSVTITDAGGCSVSDSVNVASNPPIYMTLDKVDIWCEHDSTGIIMINATGGTPPYNYTLLPNNINSTSNIFDSLPEGYYTIIVYDNYSCSVNDSISLIELHDLPPVNIMAEPTIGCQPLYVQFVETNYEYFPTNQYLWSFGDTIYNPLHKFNTSGNIDVWLTVTNEFGCDTTAHYEDLITVYPRPIANGYVYPMIVYASNDPTYTIQCYNESNGDTHVLWDFGDSTTSNIDYISHSYMNEGEFTVMLVAFNGWGCSDTSFYDVILLDDILNIPNVITPNGDGINDVFYIENIDKYPNSVLTILNRWGNTVFEANGYSNTWDAKDQPGGTYYFVLYTGNGPNNPNKVYKGSITVIK